MKVKSKGLRRNIEADACRSRITEKKKEMIIKKQMTKEEKRIIECKWYRDESRRQGELFWEIYYQAVMIGQIEQKPFSYYKRNELRQNCRLLYGMLKEILGFYDENFFMGFCYEIILSGGGVYLTGSEKKFRACIKYFANSSRKEYDRQAYELHKSYLSAFAQIDMEVAEKYADNLKRIWKLRYGVGSRYYIGMQCEIALQRAKSLRRQEQNRVAVELLQDVITKYQNVDEKDMELFHGDLFLETALNYWCLGDIDSMYRAAQAGIRQCIIFDRVGTELYYSIYNYIGIKMMLDDQLDAAANLYSRYAREIAEKFGTENENYCIYRNNLRIIAAKEGQSIDIDTQSMLNMKDETLKRQLKETICNELNFAWYNGKTAYEIERIYEKCLGLLEEDDEKIRRKADTIYLASQINAHIFNDKILRIMKKLEEKYKDRYSDELDILYWNSVAIYEWGNGRTDAAFEIYRRICEGKGEVKNAVYKAVIMNFAQLMILDEQYERAMEILLFLLNFQEKEILKVGIQDTQGLMNELRIILSMYIHLLRISPKDIFAEGEIKQLLEKIIFCKTIEREKKSFLNRRREGEVEEDLELYRQASSKLTELEFSMTMRGEDSKYYAEKKREYTLDLEEQMAKLNQRISGGEWIPAFRFEDIELPEHAVCAEYFAYYNFRNDAPMMSEFADEKTDESFSYAIFVLGKEGMKTEILNIDFVSIDMEVEEEVTNRLMEEISHPEYDGEEESEALDYIYAYFAEPVISSAEGKETVYLGVDFMLQIFPLDLVFHDRDGELFPLIMTDSVRYVKDDVSIDVRNADALIMGAPVYNIQAPERQSLPPLLQSEKECRRIAELFSVNAFVGRAASRKNFMGNAEKKVIHISVHGEVDYSGKDLFRNLTADSFLELAGYEDWKAEREVEGCGSGVITGNDFLLMDMSETDLVVLSACVSSLGTVRGLETMHGMRWAMGCAGVGSSITALWEVEERAAAILMILFYRNLLRMPVGRALYEAKRQLGRMTVDDLREDTALWEIAEEKTEGMNRTDKPFAHWKYWAGFVCYC